MHFDFREIRRFANSSISEDKAGFHCVRDMQSLCSHLTRVSYGHEVLAGPGVVERISLDLILAECVRSFRRGVHQTAVVQSVAQGRFIALLAILDALSAYATVDLFAILCRAIGFLRFGHGCLLRAR